MGLKVIIIEPEMDLISVGIYNQLDFYDLSNYLSDLEYFLLKFVKS